LKSRCEFRKKKRSDGDFRPYSQEERMPHTASAKKRMRQSEKRRLRNRSVLKAIKTEIKKTHALAQAGDKEKVAEAAKIAMGKLDKAAVKRVVHPNLAARKKSQLARLVNATKAK
jgi:small subunit ribosomal protein S20